MSEACLRSDLIVSRQETSEGIRFVVKDPRAGRYFRFREPEYAIARRLDGVRSLDDVAREVSAELGLDADGESLQPFVEQLRKQGLLDSGVVVQPRRPFVQGTVLWLRFKAFDPDRLLDRLLPRVRVCFTPQFVVAGVALIAWATIAAVASWYEIVDNLGRLWRVQSLVLAWVTVLAVTTAHEFAHGLTCKRFGGHVHEMGFLLIYFQPAFYCNISDAWLFPEKSRRLWVTFAGAFCELCIWSLAMLIWSIADPDTWISFVALVVVVTSGIKAIFNLNPLIKLDGYYLLSDYLDMPNLRQRSMGYLKSVAGRLWGAAGWTGVAPRERRIYVAYGVLAAAYSWWLLWMVGQRFGGFLIDRYQGPGFVAFSGLVMLFFKNPLTRAARSLPSGLRGAAVPESGRRWPWRRAILLAAAAAALIFIRLDLKVSGAFAVSPAHNADVRAPVAGTIEDVYVDEGIRVAAGDVLARLSDRDYRAELGQVEAEIAEKRATLDMLRAGPRKEQIGMAVEEIRAGRTRRLHARRLFEQADRIRATRLTRAEATAKAAAERLQYARTELRRSEELFQNGLISRQLFDTARQEVALREQEVEVAQSELQTVKADDLADARQEMALADTELEQSDGRLKLLLAGTRPEEIEAIEAGIARLETRKRYLEEQVRLTAVTSPAAGIVITPKLKERIGEHLAKGDLIAEVYEVEQVTPEVVISEKEIADVRHGQTVVLKARAYPGRSFTGVVTAIAPAAAEDPSLRRNVFRVTVALTDASDLLKPRMTGHAKIYCGRRPLGALLTRRLARYVRVEFWSWW